MNFLIVITIIEVPLTLLSHSFVFETCARLIRSVLVLVCVLVCNVKITSPSPNPKF